MPLVNSPSKFLTIPERGTRSGASEKTYLWPARRDMARQQAEEGFIQERVEDLLPVKTLTNW